MSTLQQSRYDSRMSPGFGPIPGLKIGHAQDEQALTGCTVLLAEEGMVAACDIRGGAVGERELSVLSLTHVVERIHAVVFSGGSAFGLDATAGVMRWCEERGIGFDTGIARVPIVPAAILYDLGLGDAKRRPDAQMGYAAAQAAVESNPAEGNVGAGTGATVGKLFGIARATKAGIGCWTEKVSSPGACRAFHVAALAAVNAFGDVCDPDRPARILAGARAAKGSSKFIGTARAMTRGSVRERFAEPLANRVKNSPAVRLASLNTILIAVATDAPLTPVEAQRLAMMAGAGVARTVSPVHTTFDGDVVFALSLGRSEKAKKSRSADVNALGAAAADAVAHAIVRSVTQAHSAGGVPALRDLKR